MGIKNRVFWEVALSHQVPNVWTKSSASPLKCYPNQAEYFFHNAGNHSPSDMVSHPRRLWILSNIAVRTSNVVAWHRDKEKWNFSNTTLSNSRMINQWWIVEDVEGIGHVLFVYLPERTEEYNTNINLWVTAMAVIQKGHCSHAHTNTHSHKP